MIESCQANRPHWPALHFWQTLLLGDQRLQFVTAQSMQEVKQCPFLTSGLLSAWQRFRATFGCKAFLSSYSDLTLLRLVIHGGDSTFVRVKLGATPSFRNR